MFDVYTEQYIQCAVKIIRKRFQFMDLLQKWAEPIHFGISRGLEKLTINISFYYRVYKQIGQQMK